MSLTLARTVADAVLYEGYLLYPYRATSRKNQVRWQFGVLGPPAATIAGVGEPSDLAAECLVSAGDGAALTVHLRFLQLQTRAVERVDPAAAAGFTPVEELVADGATWLSWEEAVEHEVVLGPFPLDDLATGLGVPVQVDGGEAEEPLRDRGGSLVGRVVRRRWPLHGQVQLSASRVEDADGLLRLRVVAENVAELAVSGKDEAIRSSFIGAHALLVAEQAEFVSLLDPPDSARDAAAGCAQHRCFPVLTGAADERTIVLVSPIILYDYPEVAEQSAGALYDSTEIDEILTLRIMTLTEEEKAAARATDPRAAEIIDRCEALSPEALQAMHGILRDPHARLDDGMPTFDDEVPTYGDGMPTLGEGLPWWDPGVDASVSPDADAVLVNGVAVSKDSAVRLHPRRRADAQDLFFAGQTARVTGVFFDVDGEVHVAVVLADDPAADLHEWYGRYLYFAPDEIEPLVREHDTSTSRKEN